MIARYTHPDMGRIWSDQRKYETWLQVEVAAAEAMARAGIVPAEAARDIRERGAFEDRSVAYTPFVRAELQRIEAENPKARALMGETQKRYFFLLLAALVSFCAFALALILVPTPLDALPYAGLVKLGLILVMAPAFGRWVLGSMPRGVRLSEIPPRALPPDESGACGQEGATRA